MYLVDKDMPVRWGEGMFPLINSNAGELLLYDINEKSKTYGKVLIYHPNLWITVPEVAYENIASMIATFTDCYRQDIFVYSTADHTLEIDQNRLF